MSQDLNKVIMSGRLGADPESRFTSSGKQVVDFRMAVSGRKDETLWLSVIAWEKTAEMVEKYLKKGSRVLVEGRLQIREYTDKKDVKRFATELVAERVLFLDSKKDAPSGDERGPLPEAEPSKETVPSRSFEGDAGVSESEDIPF